MFLLIFGGFVVVVVVVVVFLCCYVVKLGKAKKQKKQKFKTPQKVEVLPGIFYKTSYGCMCQSYCFFLAVFLFFACWSKKHYKNRVFW